jgi:hypothetical protein
LPCGYKGVSQPYSTLLARRREGGRREGEGKGKEKKNISTTNTK